MNRSVIARVENRLRQLALHEAVALLPYTTGAAALVSIALAAEKVRRQPTFPYFATVLAWAIPTFVVALALGLAFGRRAIAWSRRVSASGVTSWIVGIQVGVLLLIVPALLLTKGVAADDIQGWTFGFLNKRWLIVLYNLAVATFLVFPAAVERWRSPSATYSSVDRRPSSPRRRRVPTIGGLAVVVVLAWYFAGPPWHLERHHRGIDWHEQAHLGSLQAISKGYLPYVGPASTQYGPGSQLIMYGVMKHVGHFDIVSFRTAWAVFNFMALMAIGVVAYCAAGLMPSVLVILLTLAYSPVSFFFTASDGTFAGFYGWANALRYIAPVIVLPGLARAAVEGRPAASRKAPWVVLMGVICGIGAWIAQENLSTTIMAGGLLFILLWLTRTVSLSRAFWVVCHVTIGFACVATPVLIFYALNGTAGTFVHNYFLMPRAVAVGYSNTWWPVGDGGSAPYYFTAPFLIASAVCALWRLPALRLEVLDGPRTRFLAFVCIQLACYQTALFRSDAAHLRNTMIALPFVLALGVLDLPRWLAMTPPGRAAIRVAFIVLAVAIYPALRQQNWRDVVVTPVARFRALTPGSDPRPPDAQNQYEGRPAFKRATNSLTDEPILAFGSGLSVRTFLEFATDIHDLIGPRKTYVAELGGHAWPGLLYFMADLTPAPYPLDTVTMMINDNLRTQVADHIRAHADAYQSFISTSLDDPEAQAFLQSHPGAVLIERSFAAGTPPVSQTVHVVLAHTTP